MLYDYTLIRSRRKTLTLQVTRDLCVQVRAPQRMPKREIDRFVEKNTAWITTHLEKQRCLSEAHPEPDAAEQAELLRRAKAYLPGRVAHYAALMGLYPTGLKITAARARFGSCSSKNSLCFSWRLLRYPVAAIDYVVVHELAHIAHKNHGKDFYACIAAVLPDYQARRALLK